MKRTMKTAAMLGLLGAAACGGGLTPAMKQHIVERIEERRVGLESCYARELSLNPTLQAEMLVAFEIKAGSKLLRSVRLKGNVDMNPQLERCLVDELQAVTLERAPDVRVQSELPVQFTPMVRTTSFGSDFEDSDDTFEDDGDLK